MPIFCGIDGTGNLDLSPDGPDRHAALSDQPSGFVKQVGRLGFHARQYYPGPRDAMTGRSVADTIAEARQWVLEAYHHPVAPEEDKRIYLSGFSRGGAAAIVLAHQLRELGIPVEGMFLFDAVDRSPTLPNDQTMTIPGNVRRAWHAIRAPEAMSRVAFGNCGLRSEADTLTLAEFHTTHGGVGGWPNGPDRVLPGLGVEHAAALLVPGRRDALTPEMQRNIHERFEPFPTAIDPAQEVRGGRAAWRWMRDNAIAALERGSR